MIHDDDEEEEELPPPPITDEEILQDEITQVLMSVYGEYVMRCVHSPKWSHRIEAIKTVSIKQFHPKTRLMIVDCLIADRISQVYFEVLNFLENTVLEIFKRREEREYEQIMSALILYLVRTRLNDSNNRVRQCTSQFFITLCSRGEMERIFCTTLLLKDKINKKKKKKNQVITPKGELTYLGLLNTVAREYGFRPKSDKIGLTIENFVPVSLATLESKNLKIRQASSELIATAKLSLKSNRRTAFDERFLYHLSVKTLKSLKTELESLTENEISIDMNHLEKLKEAEKAVRLLAEKELENNGTTVPATMEEQTQPNTVLSEKDQELVAVFGEGVLHINSKQWKQREFVLEQVKHVIPQETDSDTSQKKVKCSVDLISRSLTDNVPQVYISGIQLIPILFSSSAMTFCTKSTIQKLVTPILKSLVSKTGDMNAKIQEQSQKTLLYLSSHEKVTLKYVNIFIMEPIEEFIKGWRTIVGRLNVLQLMVPQFGMSEAKGGLSVERVMTFCVTTFSSTNAQVKTAAIDCIVEVYKVAGDRIRSYLREQNSHILQELKKKVVKEARITSNQRTNSAPIRIASVVAPMRMDSSDQIPSSFVSSVELDLRPQSYDSGLSEPASIFRKNQSPKAKAASFVSLASINTKPTIQQRTKITKGQSSRFIFN
jgi:hypothetical protein